MKVALNRATISFDLSGFELDDLVHEVQDAFRDQLPVKVTIELPSGEQATVPLQIQTAQWALGPAGFTGLKFTAEGRP